MTWAEWAGWHGTTFGFHLTHDGVTPSAEAAMLHRWGGLFAERGFTPEDALRASRRMVEDAPRFLRDHLPVLLRLMRAPAAEEAAPPPADGGVECRLCRGTGRVYVPDPDRLAQRKVCVVYCRCPLGRWFRQSSPAAKATRDGAVHECRIWTIDQVEECLPDWRAYLEAWERERAGEAAEIAQAGDLDRAMGRLMRKLRGGAG